ncbi:MAG: hypothetical protein WD267_07625 [Balneolales bacterium]
MTEKKEVRAFLKEFKEKMKIWDVLFRDDRGKNTQALSDLELIPIQRKKILEELRIENYSDGPNEEVLYGGSDMWIFGKEVKGTEVYIKITVGSKGKSVICISFHLAEHIMSYPFK